MLSCNVIRTLLLRDGRVKTSFEDGTWIILEPTGACYTYFDSKGKVPQERCMTEFARHKQNHKLALALDFRNAHSPCPFWCQALEKLGKRTWTSQVRVERASWLISKDLKYDTSEDSLKVKSKDGRCMFHLLSNKLRFSICFPVLYKTTESDSGPVYSYYLQLQHFSSRECPSQWRALLDAVQEQLSCEEENRSNRLLVTELPEASTSGGAEWIPIDQSSFWDSHKEILYPRDTAVVVEWTPNCMFRFAYDLNEVEVLIFFNNSIMLSRGTGKEFQHFMPRSGGTGPGDHVYRPANLLEGKKMLVTLDKISDNKKESLFAFYHKVVEYGSKFLEHAMLVKRVVAHREYEANSKSAPLISNEIFFEKYFPDIGKTIAFEDRRVWIKFVDKTFLEMDHEHSYCKVTLPRGDVRIVRVHKPVGVEDYVQIAREFASWVFHTPNERDKQIQLYATIQTQVEASKRMSKMISWHLGGMDAALLL